MNNNIPLYLTFFCCSLLLSAPLSALDADDPDLGGFIEEPKWQESKIAIPPFPNRDELVKVEVDRVDMPFTFSVDFNSLSLDKDGVSRYTVVIESDTGASNIMYEGIRCSTNEYRTYAYGTYDDKFSEARISNWTKIASKGAMAHRYNFRRYYMCNGYGQPLSVKEIKQRIRYPENFSGKGLVDD